MSLSLCQSVYQSVCLFLSLSVSLSSFSSVCQSIRTAFFRCLTETLTSQIILSYPILLNRLYPILSHNIPSYLIPYYRIISYSFSVHPIISHHIISITSIFASLRLHRVNSPPLYVYLSENSSDVECSPYESEASSGTLLVSARLYLLMTMLQIGNPR